MKNIQTKIGDGDAAKLTELFPTVYEGAKTSIEAYLALRNASLLEIRNIGYTQEELFVIVDSLNGTMSTDVRLQANLSFFIAHLEDFERLENGFARHGADYSAFVSKANSMTSAQVFFLQEEIFRWWNNEKRADLFDFIKLFQK